MKKNKLITLFKRLCIVIIFIYTISIFVNQQKSLNSYKKTSEQYIAQIKEQEEYKESLIELKNNVNSTEYIEKIAREKLGMYFPYEKVYIDIGK